MEWVLFFHCQLVFYFCFILLGQELVFFKLVLLSLELSYLLRGFVLPEPWSIP